MKPLYARDNSVILRQLNHGHRQELEEMISRSPVAHLFEAEYLEKFGLPAPGFPMPMRPPYGFVGIFRTVEDPKPASAERQVISKGRPESTSEGTLGRAKYPHHALRAMAQHFFGASAHRASTASTTEELVGAIWLGGNCVPLHIPAEYTEHVADFVVRNSKYIASIFGVAELVLPLWEHSQHGFPQVLDQRPTQPLLYLGPATPLNHSSDFTFSNPNLPPIAGGVRWARTGDRASLLQASVAMFTEEVGYDPLERDAAGYTRRVSEFITTGRSLVATNTEGAVIFKTDLGLVHHNQCQLQGVWLHPAYRGQGMATSLMAQTCQLIRPRYPHISLYVNDYNVRARALYSAVGFKQIDTFSTILL